LLLEELFCSWNNCFALGARHCDSSDLRCEGWRILLARLQAALPSCESRPVVLVLKFVNQPRAYPHQITGRGRWDSPQKSKAHFWAPPGPHKLSRCLPDDLQTSPRSYFWESLGERSPPRISWGGLGRAEPPPGINYYIYILYRPKSRIVSIIIILHSYPKRGGFIYYY
jgi:hypothetical protein